MVNRKCVGRRGRGKDPGSVLGVSSLRAGGAAGGFSRASRKEVRTLNVPVAPAHRWCSRGAREDTERQGVPRELSRPAPHEGRAAGSVPRTELMLNEQVFQRASDLGGHGGEEQMPPDCGNV